MSAMTLEQVRDWHRGRQVMPGRYYPKIAKEHKEFADAIDAHLTAHAQMVESLKDPEHVHAMMLRGAVAVPTIRSMVHLRGEVPNGEDFQLVRIAELQEQHAQMVEKVREVIAWVRENDPNWSQLSKLAAAIGDAIDDPASKT